MLYGVDYAYQQNGGHSRQFAYAYRYRKFVTEISRSETYNLWPGRAAVGRLIRLEVRSALGVRVSVILAIIPNLSMLYN